MDQLKKKKKHQFDLFLQVNIPDVIPEEVKTSYVSTEKLQTDLFFLQPVQTDQPINDSTQQITLKGKLVADISQIKGGRKRQEDRYVALPDFYSDSKGNQFFYAVYDGHGGSLIADILQNNLHNYLSQNENFKTNIRIAILESFKCLNDQILKLQVEKQVDGGSTALCVMNIHENLFVMNLGDSTSVIVDQELNIEKINQEHNLDREDELIRVQNLCTILDRSHIPRINGEIAVTRSFGDKKHTESGIIAVPEITHKILTPKDKYLIIATDGFWNVISMDELKTLLINWSQRLDGQDSVIEQLSWFLIQTAQNKNTHFKKDNMTLLVVDLQQSLFVK